jgi:hypothetical protein
MVAEIFSCLDKAATLTGDGASMFRLRSSAGEVCALLLPFATVVLTAAAEDADATLAGAVVVAVGTTDVASLLPNNSRPPPKSTFTRPVLVMLTPPIPPSLSKVPERAVGPLAGTMIMPGNLTSSATGEMGGDC